MKKKKEAGSEGRKELKKEMKQGKESEETHDE